MRAAGRREIPSQDLRTGWSAVCAPSLRGFIPVDKSHQRPSPFVELRFYRFFQHEFRPPILSRAPAAVMLDNRLCAAHRRKRRRDYAGDAAILGPTGPQPGPTGWETLATGCDSGGTFSSAALSSLKRVTIVEVHLEFFRAVKRNRYNLKPER